MLLLVGLLAFVIVVVVAAGVTIIGLLRGWSRLSGWQRFIRFSTFTGLSLVILGACFALFLSALGSRIPEPSPMEDLPPPRMSVPSPTPPLDLPKAEIERIQRAVSNLPEGSLTFNPPKEMRVGEAQDMEAVVSRKVYDRIEALHGGRSSVQLSLKIAPEMVASLTASPEEFRITPLMPKNPDDMMSFGPDGRIHWIWRIEPLQAGQNMEMLLVIQAVFEVEDGGKVRRIDAWTKDVTIRVNARKPWEIIRDFIKEHLEWLWGGLVAFVLWVWDRLRKRLSQADPNAPLAPGPSTMPAPKQPQTTRNGHSTSHGSKGHAGHTQPGQSSGKHKH